MFTEVDTPKSGAACIIDGERSMEKVASALTTEKLATGPGGSPTTTSIG